MKTTIELFCGTKSFSKVAEKRGHATLTVDNDKQHNPDVLKSVLEITKLPTVDFLWCSPPCTCFSIASMGKHWGGGFREYQPKTESAKLGLILLDKTIKLIKESKPKRWYIENPRGMMRKKIDEIFKINGVTDYKRHTISYCQYGDKRMKPTDIWTNDNKWTPKPMCKNGSPCHEAAPRGSKTGTQGLKGHIERGVIPPSLFEEIFSHNGV